MTPDLLGIDRVIYKNGHTSDIVCGLHQEATQGQWAIDGTCCRTQRLLYLPD